MFCNEPLKLSLLVFALLFFEVVFAKPIYSIDPYREAFVIGTGAAISLAAELNSDTLVMKKCPCDSSEINSLDRTVVGNSDSNANQTSDILLGFSILGPAIYYSNLAISEQSDWSDFVVYLEVLSTNSSINSVSKYSVLRPRPAAYAGKDLNSADSYTSFYSGHTSTTFAALSSLSINFYYRHPEYKYWPWILTGLVGSAVANERVKAGKHFYSDVIAGAAVGTFIGSYIPIVHKLNYAFFIIPGPSWSSVSWKFSY